MPFLTVSNGKKAVEFYIGAMGAIEMTRYDNRGGRITSRMFVEGAEFWVGDEEPEFGNVSPGTATGTPVRIVLKTINADIIYERALQLGATQICAMTTEDHWRIGKLKDPFGHVWEIGYIL